MDLRSPQLTLKSTQLRRNSRKSTKKHAKLAAKRLASKIQLPLLVRTQTLMNFAQKIELHLYGISIEYYGI